MYSKETLIPALKLVSALYREGHLNAATYRRIMEKYA